MRIGGIPNYQDLDVSGEALAAAERMEARAREPASERMFEALVRPLLPTRAGARVLEVGAGPGALSRRIARALPQATVHATDKSEGMIAVGRRLAEDAKLANLELESWDVTVPDRFPFEDRGYDLIVSSVMVPYLSDAQTEQLVRDLAARLAPEGMLAFIEQDLQTDALNFPDHDLLRRVFAKDERGLKRTVALGLRPLLRAVGLELLSRASYLWTDDTYGPYLRDLLSKLSEDAKKAGRLSAEEQVRWSNTLEQLLADGDFHYGLVYHRIAGRAARR